MHEVTRGGFIVHTFHKESKLRFKENAIFIVSIVNDIYISFRWGADIVSRMNPQSIFMGRNLINSD